jgi:hypothetical protein
MSELLDYAPPADPPAEARRSLRLAWVAGAFPIVLLLSAHLTWLLASVALGRAPRAFVDDPTAIAAGVSTAYAVTAFLAGCYAHAIFISAALAIGAGVTAERMSAGLRRMTLAALPWAAAALYGALDPLRVVAWLAD